MVQDKGIVLDINSNIEGKCLDNVEEVLNLNKPITAIKIDVEGYEFNVLKGGVETIKKHKPIIYCELWSGDQREETIDLMKSMGYSVKVIDGMSLIDFSKQSTQNFFFLPSSV